MLRTRRRDNNVKPNRRLDRKSSRGMLYENEELRLKTININAEIERGQSDIKKLKRENEMLKKEIWCLRDEYDKLDKLLKDKKLDFSSSSTTYSSSSSESESCSSCTEESEEVETSQNLLNVQRTNFKNVRDQFDHLSIVTEETSYENSFDLNSVNTRHSLPNDPNDAMLWNYDKDVIKPDQSYPAYGSAAVESKSQTLPNQMPVNFFTPIQHSKSFDENHFNQVHQAPLFPGDFYTTPTPLSGQDNTECQTPPVAISPSPPPLYENQQVLFSPERNNCETEHFLSKKIVNTSATNFYQNMVPVPKNVNPPAEVKSMEKKATDLIVKIDNQNFNRNLTYSNTTPSTTFSNGGNLEELLHDIESISQRGLPTTNQQEPADMGAHCQNQNLFNAEGPETNPATFTGSEERLHKSELNVVLMPKAMPLIGFDKYKKIQRSFESLNSKHLDSMSASQQNLCLMPPSMAETTCPIGEAPRPRLHVTIPSPTFNVEGNSNYTAKVETSHAGKEGGRDLNPFFFGNLNDNYVNSDYFSRRYNPDHLVPKNEQEAQQRDDNDAAENDENIKLKTTKQADKDEKKQEPTKSPKMSITKKVSIHFKGKKEKDKLKKLALSGGSSDGGKTPLFDFKVLNDIPEDTKDLSSAKAKDKTTRHAHQKTPSIESKKSTTETSNCEAKTPNSSESDRKNTEKKDAKEKKLRKSISISPERGKHVHMLHDVQSIRKHKKHKRSGGTRLRRDSTDPRLRERSYSVCTDRSIAGPGLGLGYGSFLYDDYSDRERTNSGSSCDSHENHRKMSGMSTVPPLNGKVPWCGCWGNGCL